MDLTMSSLTSQIETIQREIVEIHGYIARPEASVSIDRRTNISIDSHRRTSIDEATNRGRLVPKMKSDMSDTHNHGDEISTDTYTTLMRHQFNLESLGDRLQNIENTTATMKDIWCKGDEAIRHFTDFSAESYDVVGASIIYQYPFLQAIRYSERYDQGVMRSCLAFQVLFFAAAWLIPLIFELSDMTWITRSCQGYETGAASCDTVFRFVTVVMVEVAPETRVLERIGVGVKNGYDKKKHESSDKSSRRIATQRPNACSAWSLRSDRVRAKAQSLHSDRTPIPLGRYVATELEPELGRYVATELEPKFGRYVATELFRNVDTTSVHAFSSTLRCYLPNTVANPSHIPRLF
ncbi:hypothetical protein F2Q69_00030713 [Brassica cretica]|uniref:Uncharacterized protein n=1 Tax=Brassica cretica TaxID=69181 RepID=A0A8S9RWW8_BRACR|nr:hypothetical protein F2Q69_00030713 [Brassica cretica]